MQVMKENLYGHGEVDLEGATMDNGSCQLNHGFYDMSLQVHFLTYTKYGCTQKTLFIRGGHAVHSIHTL